MTLRARQGGEELVVLALHPIGPQGELAAGAGPLVVGQEGVVADDRGERALGESEDHHEIEVEADPHLDRADEHTIPEATNAAEVLLELELERAVEHLEGDGVLHRVESTEPVQRLVDALGRSVLDGIPSLAAGAATEEPDEPPLGPVGVVAPGPGLRGLGREVVDHLQHEPAQIASPVGLLALSLGHPLGEVVVELGLVGSLVAQQGVLAEAQIPVAPARDDGGLAGQPIPAGGGRQAALAQDRGRRQPREDVLASIAARGEGEQVEQRAARDPRREWDDGGTVGRDAGGTELLVGEAGIGLGTGVQHRDPIEPGAAAHGRDDRAHRRSHLFVAVGRGEHGGALGGDRRDLAHRALVRGRDPEPPQRSEHLGVGGLVADDGRDDRGGEVIAKGREQRCAVLGDALGQVDDERPELCGRGRAHLGGGREQEVFLVVPRRLEASARRRVQAHDLPGAVARSGQRREGGGGEVAQLPVGAHERCFGGRVLRHGCEQPGLGGQLGAHRRGQAPAWTPVAARFRPAWPRRGARPTGRW